MRPSGIGAEDEAVLTIVKRVEDHLERVHVAHAGVSTRVADDDLRRIGVVADRSDVQVEVVVQDTHFRQFGCGLSFERFRLNKIRQRHRLFPDGFIQNAVDFGCRRGSGGRGGHSRFRL